MLSKSQPFFWTVVFLSSLLISNVSAEELTAEEIITKANQVRGGYDSISDLEFLFQNRGDKVRRHAYKMLWKDYPDDPKIDSKLIFFSEFPPDTVGTAFMAWIYPKALNQEEDHWLYMPSMRTVRKLTHIRNNDLDEGGQHHGHDVDEGSDPFAKSELQRAHLDIRHADLDILTLLPKETIRNREYYVVEAVPKEQTKDYPYSKAKIWIEAKYFLKSKIDYFVSGDQLELRHFIKWKKIGDDWVWEKVAARNFRTGNKTHLNITNIQLNVGLQDRDFTKRVMKGGQSRIKQIRK